MTYSEIDKAMVDVTRQKCIECKSRLDSVPKENATERKALQLEYGMYTFCGNCGLLFNTTGERRIVQTRRNFIEKQLHRYPQLNSVYQTIDKEEKLRFIAALQAELFIRDQWLVGQCTELAAAENSDDTKKIFEFRIKIGAAKNMFAAWEAWRVEKDIYPHMFSEESE